MDKKKTLKEIIAQGKPGFLNRWNVGETFPEDRSSTNVISFEKKSFELALKEFRKKSDLHRSNADGKDRE